MTNVGAVLVAEDSRLLLQLLQDALLAHGFGSPVLGWSTGESLLDQLDRRLQAGEEASLYLLDLTLPGMGGLEVARAIRRLEAAHQATVAPILFYTALASTAEVEATLTECWPARYLQKEVGARPDRLAMTIIRFLGEIR